jgi:uncharacterized repeat protein (TIGR01451 family)
MGWLRYALLGSLLGGAGCQALPDHGFRDKTPPVAATRQTPQSTESDLTSSTATARINDTTDSPARGTTQGHSVVPVGYESIVEKSSPADRLTTGPREEIPFAAQLPSHSVSFVHGGHLPLCKGCGTACGGACNALGTTHGVQGDCVGFGAYAPVIPSIPNAQEYLFDGGDMPPRVLVRSDWTAAGVDPSDTVIYYETLGGQVCVTPSNRVPIYAPRFGAVRQVSGLELAQRAVGTERFLAPVTPVGMQENNKPGNVSLPLAPRGEQQINLLDAFQEHRGGIPIAQVLPPYRMSEAIRPVENLTFFTTGEIVDVEVPVLGRILANAREWTNPESIQVEIQGQAAALVVDSKRAQDVHVYEMPDKCAMRICKAASHNVANSGDIVRFTIRFDNIGPKPLGNAVVMDSLVPRLEYIVGSQHSSVPAIFTATPNDVGSHVLRWEIEEAIAPATGGVISFDCRVR